MAGALGDVAHRGGAGRRRRAARATAAPGTHSRPCSTLARRQSYGVGRPRVDPCRRAASPGGRWRGRRGWWTTRTVTTRPPIAPRLRRCRTCAASCPRCWRPRGVDRCPTWMPAARGARRRQVVLLVLDGLGLGAAAGAAPSWRPTIAGRSPAGRSPRSRRPPPPPRSPRSPPGSPRASTASSATAWTIGGEVLNVLRWCTPHGDARRRIEPRADASRSRRSSASDVPVVSKAELRELGVHRGAPARCRTRSACARPSSSLPVEVGDLLRAGERFVYAYYDGIDKVAHERGFGPFYDAELRAADRLVADVLDALPAGAVLLVTADHGQVDVGDDIVTPTADVLRPALATSRRGPVPLAARPARRGGRPARCRAASDHGDVAWVRSRAEQSIDDGWFGPVVAPARRRTARRRRARRPRRRSASTTRPTAGRSRWCAGTAR